MHVRTITPGDVLREASLVLKTYGWIQGDNSNEDGYCLVGALMQARNIHIDLFPEAVPEVDEAYHGAFNRLCSDLNNSPVSAADSISSWNDQPERTKDEVVELLERVARG